MNGVDVTWIRTVKIDELSGLDRGVGDKSSASSDNLFLADNAQLRLGSIPVGKFKVLDLRHGVHGVHERNIPTLGSEPAHLAGEPVVRVNESEPALGVRCLDTKQAGGDSAQLTGEVFLA